jgi:hypothetical protein
MGTARLLRAAALGLVGGLFIGGLYLLWVASRVIFSGVACLDQGPEQCSLEQELALHLARRQALTGGALALLAVAIGIWIRAKSVGHRQPRERE